LVWLLAISVTRLVGALARAPGRGTRPRRVSGGHPARDERRPAPVEDPARSRKIAA
jgi:hypothetical protein